MGWWWLIWSTGQLIDQLTALLENLTKDAIAKLNVTTFSTISLYLTKLYGTLSVAFASSVTCSEIWPNISNSGISLTINYQRTVWSVHRNPVTAVYQLPTIHLIDSLIFIQSTPWYSFSQFQYSCFQYVRVYMHSINMYEYMHSINT